MVGRGLLFAVVIVAGFGGLPMVSARAAAFICPDTTAGDLPGTAPPTIGPYAGTDDITAGNRLSETIAELRRSGTKPSLIVDRLIGAYGPLVAADTALSDKQKADRVRRFARLVTGLAFVPPDPDEVDVIVETPLTPNLLSQIDQAAVRAGISRNEWIERAIERQLAVR